MMSAVHVAWPYHPSSRRSQACSRPVQIPADRTSTGLAGRIVRIAPTPTTTRVSNSCSKSSTWARLRSMAVNDLDYLRRVLQLLGSHGIAAWVFGGWGEQLRPGRASTAP